MATKKQKQDEDVALATMPEPAPQNEQEALAKVPPEQDTALATAEQIDNMFGGSGYQIPIDAPLPQIEILREIPRFKTPDGETVKSITVHIIHWHHANQYYDSKFGEGEEGPPTCASPDGIKPIAIDDGVCQSDVCRTCPKNQYGSADKGGGKACANTIRLYVLVEGEVIPCLIKATPASLSKKESLMKWLTSAPNIAAKAGAGTKYQLIRVKFSLHTKDFADSGFSASVLDLETVRVLDPKDEGDMAEIFKLGKLYGNFMDSYIRRIKDDVTSEHQQSESEESTESEGDEIPI